MDTAAWRKAIKYCADPDRARLALERLSRCGIEAELESASPTIAGFAAALFAASEAGTDLLVAHPDCWAAIFDEERLEFPRHEQGLRRDVGEWLEPALKALDYAGALRRLREFKQRDQLRIAVRDLARKGDAAEITRELSNLADICLATVFQICWRQLTERLGTPYHQDVEGDWTATPFTVIGLGKLGGQELNYSSDVDVMFLYGEEGTVFREPPGRKSDPDRSMTNHTFFKRLAETIVAEVARPAAEGQLFRIDVRLRPEGDAGPLVRSLASYENYYAQWGQVWERMMLIKARGVAGDVELAHEFLEMINPFRYPRSLNEGVVREIAAMKERIEVEVVKAGELERNVKLGRGGIREIEFIAQMHQLLHAGRLPFLQGTQTLPTLRNLVRYYLLPGAEAEALAAAYLFLRDTEHRIQMDQHRQSHTLPASKAARERIARLMGCPALAQFDKRLKAHTSFVHRTYKRFFRGESRAGEGQLPADFQEARSAWEQLLGEHGFREPTQAVRLLQGFVHGPGFVHVSPHTERLARGLIGRFLALCPSTALLGRIGKPDVRVLSDPDRVITRIDAFVTAYGTRAGLFETWTRNPKLFELLLLLFDRSEFLAETAIRHPDLVDDLVLSGWLRRRKDAGIILEELRRGMTDKDQHRWLRRYHRSEQMRIGLREILGLMNHDEVMEVLSALGEACLQYGLETVTRRHRLKSAPFAVIGLGKLGGRELNYGSDLDVLFVAPAKSRRLPRLQKIAADLI
ncbi:MAG TPA: hypothetical protein DCY13_20170, partial [Verrucomicrobiales bacterium]|nr:hypothetical protein [Verrucomicrobiales bacterium]